MADRQTLFAALKDILVEEFEIDAALITEQAHLYQDLDLDSIDAVDLVIKLQQITGNKLKPEAFKAVRTIADVLTELERLTATGTA